MYSCAAVLWRLAQRRIDLKGRVLDLASLELVKSGIDD